MQKKTIFTPAFNQQLIEDVRNSSIVKEKLERAILAFSKDKSMQEFLRNRNIA